MKGNFVKTALCGALVLASAAMYAADVKVLSVTGKVEVFRNNNWIPVTTSFLLNEGEEISTGFNSQAVFRYNDSSFKVGPLTRITLEKLATQEKKDDVSLYVSTGSVRSTVRHTDNKRVTYTVRNPVAVASVRGTDFTFMGNGKVTCYDGAVALHPGSTFDAKSRGIAKPADGSAGASADDVAKAAQNVPAEGTSNTTTAASDIDPYSESGEVVAAGQTSEINTVTGIPNKGVAVAQAGISSIASKGNSLAAAEAVSAGAPRGERPQSAPKQNVPADSSSKATIAVTVTIAE